MSRVVFDFTGENFVVTGASSGMGRQVAVELATAGANVLAIARNEARLQELQAQYPANISVAALDVCDSEKMENAIKDFVKEHGKLHGGVHGAGITDITPLKSYDKDKAHKIMDINFWAGANFLQYATKKRISNDGASFVLFSSVYAQSSPKGMFVYGAAKAGINIAVQSLSKEIAKRKQRVNSIMPGWVETGMTDMIGDISNKSDIVGNELLGTGSPCDVTGMVLFLLSDRGCWITGSNIAVDGGYLA